MVDWGLVEIKYYKAAIAFLFFIALAFLAFLLSLSPIYVKKKLSS